jgi:large subunit ribosomal protein L24
MNQKIKKGAVVSVISGDDKGKQGKVLLIDYKKGLAKVEGIALVVRHYKARKAQEKSEIKIRESFIHISNIAIK